MLERLENVNFNTNKYSFIKDGDEKTGMGDRKVKSRSTNKKL